MRNLLAVRRERSNKKVKKERSVKQTTNTKHKDKIIFYHE